MTRERLWQIGALILLMVAIMPVNAAVFNITESHGATWIRWDWEIPLSHATSSTQLVVIVDGVDRYSMCPANVSEMLESFTLSDVNPDEYHRLELVDMVVANGTVVVSEESVVKTDQSLAFFVMIMLTGVFLVIVSLFMRNQLLALMLTVCSTVLFLYTGVVSVKSYTTMSTICIILSVVSSFLCIYLLYGLYRRNLLLEVEDV